MIRKHAHDSEYIFEIIWKSCKRANDEGVTKPNEDGYSDKYHDPKRSFELFVAHLII